MEELLGQECSNQTLDKRYLSQTNDFTVDYTSKIILITVDVNRNIILITVGLVLHYIHASHPE